MGPAFKKKERKGEKSDEECKEEKAAMEKTYVKAYVELSRLKSEYDELANSTACFDRVKAEFKQKKDPLQEEADDLADKIADRVKLLRSLRPRLESAEISEKMLRKHVKKLTEQCEDLEPTISDLDKVRDAIRALSECPGLSRLKFELPVWTGEWCFFEQDAQKMSDEAQDKAMDQACNKCSEGSRAAITAEIEEQTVEQIPVKNTAPAPLIGTCPNCEGDDGDEYK